MRFVNLAAAAMLPLGLSACSDGKVDEAKVEEVAADVESAGEELVQEGEAALDKAGDEIEKTAEEAGAAVENGVDDVER